jgi:hypothetical protein
VSTGAFAPRDFPPSSPTQLHASANHDGQLSSPSQKGIHSRFESTLVNQYASDLFTFETSPPRQYDDVYAASVSRCRRPSVRKLTKQRRFSSPVDLSSV